MGLIIRKLLAVDFPEVQKLFVDKKVLNELKWLFVNPDNESEINAYVAEKDNDIIGVLGYSMSDFNINGKSVKGIIPMSWMVAPDHRGLAGIQLLKEVLNLGEFGFAITLSETAKKVYPIVKLKLRTSATVYQKVIRPYPIKSGLIKFIFSIFGFTFGGVHDLFNTRNKDLKLNEINNYEQGLSNEMSIAQPAFSNIVSSNKVKWLLHCPTIDRKYYFQIILKNEIIGFIVCYVNKNKKGVIRGRIIHLSYLGEKDKIWRQVIRETESRLRKDKCSVVTVLAKNTTFGSGI